MTHTLPEQIKSNLISDTAYATFNPDTMTDGRAAYRALNLQRFQFPHRLCVYVYDALEYVGALECLGDMGESYVQNRGVNALFSHDYPNHKSIQINRVAQFVECALVNTRCELQNAIINNPEARAANQHRTDYIELVSKALATYQHEIK